MAGEPRWKVYGRDGEYLAACKHTEDAAAVVALNGDGATIRDGHAAKHTVWTEGQERYPANESYDYVAQTILHRVTLRGQNRHLGLNEA